MSLRCWPGALCEVKWTAPHCAHLIGTRIVVTALSPDDEPPAWFYTTFDGRPLMSCFNLPIRVACDHCLQPIDPETGADWSEVARDQERVQINPFEFAEAVLRELQDV